MKATRITHRYARAIFAVASAAGVVRETLADLQAVVGYRESDRDAAQQLSSVLLHPRVWEAKKSALIDGAFGAGIGKIALRCLHLLVRTGRLREGPVIVDALEALIRESEGRQTALVSTAVELSDDRRREIVGRLEQLTGKTIEATFSVEPRLLGGIVIHLGDRLIDGSVRYHLDTMRADIKGLYLH
ncbi:MAG: ATP synthase F1 subunit delta [Candidatus Riflebacteria bacterium]|nr:ATP synthase F1 subunit delta [Candidatus Riflebacteria bacterium]